MCVTLFCSENKWKYFDMLNENAQDNESLLFVSCRTDCDNWNERVSWL